ncbi:hypothetical protein QTI17_04055 [Variovorax sp. J31P179]|uniref:hypothetical protein n=1 Tax=Variovorax sp. J31P179 TaxID=3053508 RepID=UPI0025755022|nr:hypothetical protein [Variovorax sp. J31P179]MDM0079759.1 hypothetical protein [Variovorax sp. J31P179]
MLTIDQKEAILRRAGTTVPDFPPVRPTPVAPRRRDGPSARRQAIEEWSDAVAALYVEHIAARGDKK